MRIHKLTLLTLLGTTVLATPAWSQVEPTAPPERPQDAQPLGPAVAGEAAPAKQDPGQAPGASVEGEGGLSDIVVTARRRVEPLQDTPLAVSAINAERLEEARVTNITDLTSLTPSITLARNSTNPVSLFPWIRGFGTKSTDPAQEPPIALTIDGIYQAQLIGAFINLFDVEAVEVLRGPQGTLLGKNSPAGGVAIRTRRPGEDFGMMVQADYSSFENTHLRGYVDVPIVSDTLFATFSANYQHSDGYMRNTRTGTRFGGVDVKSFRLGLLANISDNVVWYVSAQYDMDQGEDAGNRNVSTTDLLLVPGLDYAVLPNPSLTCLLPYSSGLCTSGVLPQTKPYTTRATPQPPRDSSNLSFSSNLDIDTGPVAFTSVTGYRRFREFSFSDIDGTELGIIDSGYDGHYRAFSQELRVASSDGGGLDLDGRLNWLLGVYYFNYDYDRLNNQIILGNVGATYQEGITNSYALFAHAEYEILDGLSFSAGGRQTWDRKRHLSCAALCQRGMADQITERASWDNFSYDLTLNYDLTPDNMIYIRYATGYRGGGFTGVPASPAASAVADPETVKAWEFGSKNDFFNHRLRVNLSVFRNEFSDLQRVVSEPIDIAPFFLQRLRNVAEGVTQGVEVEVLARPVPDLTLRGSVGYLDAKYTTFFANVTGVEANGNSDLTFLHFPYTSKWSAQVGATYEMDLGGMGSLSLSADYAYRSRYNVTDLNYAFGEQDGFGLLSSMITWRDESERFSLSLYGRNLTDEFYIDGGDAIGGLSTYVSDGPPREIGISAGFRF